MHTQQIPATEAEASSSEQVTDAELWRQFVHDRKDSAFELILRRHGPMVMGVCRRVLGATSDAEDAFQATFLLLVQRGTAIRSPERLASWLYGVAHRIAVKARSRGHRRRQQTVSVEGEILPELSRQEGTSQEFAWRELLEVLDQELSALPDSQRLPLILCYLQGKTNIEAADQLGWPRGSISGRLSKARAVLRRRLVRRGLPLSAALLAYLLNKKATATPLPALLAEYTLNAMRSVARGSASPNDAVSPAIMRLLPSTPMPRSGWHYLAATLLLVVLLILGSLGAASLATRGRQRPRGHASDPVEFPREHSGQTPALPGSKPDCDDPDRAHASDSGIASQQTP